MTKSSEIDLEMMKGFDFIEEYFSNHPLAPPQAKQLQLTTLILGILKYSYRPIKHLISKPNILEGIDECQSYAMEVRGNRRKESHGAYYLSQSEVKEFESKGILGPYTLISPSEAECLRKNAEKQHARDFDNTILFGNEKLREVLKKHNMWNINYSGMYQALRYPEWSELLASKEITQRIASLIGNDIICWRSQFFEKKPGDIGTFWHQTGTFRETSEKAKLKPTKPMSDPLVQLTAWVALTDVTIKNGCMRILPSSYKDGRFERIAYNIKDKASDYLLTLSLADIKKAIHALKYSPGNFLKAQLVYELALKEVPNLFEGYETQDLQMKAGQFIIFTSLNIHGSYPNITSDLNRLAIAGRYTTNDVKVYDNFPVDTFAGPEGDIAFSTKPLACFQVMGQDKFGHNHISDYQNP